MDRRVALPGLTAIHLAVAVAHGTSHFMLPVVLGPWLNLVVLATVFVGPVVGVALVVRGHRLGLPLFTAAMAGGLAVGLLFHFLVENPDHVRSLPGDPWRFPFRASAAGVALTGGLGVALGAWYWRSE